MEGVDARRPEGSSIQALQAPVETSYQLSLFDKGKWQQNQAQSKGHTELKSLILSFFDYKTP
jgi:hypothetical protein